jgi:hypothetical protein
MVPAVIAWARGLEWIFEQVGTSQIGQKFAFQGRTQ